MGSQKQNRVLSTIIYLVALAGIHFRFVDRSFTPDLTIIWLFTGGVSLILGSRLLTPHFTPPADAVTNSMFVSIAMLTFMGAESTSQPEKLLAIATLGTFILVLISGLLILLIKAPNGLETRPWLLTWERSVRGAGNPIVVFTAVIIVAVIAVHLESPQETAAILISWTVIVALRPVDAALDLFRWWNEQRNTGPKELLGVVAAYQSPGIVLIRQTDAVPHARGTLMLIGDSQGPTRLGVAVNYVGRDEGHLLRTLSLDLPSDLKSIVGESIAIDGAARLLAVDDEMKEKAGKAIAKIDRLCGIVDHGTTLDRLEFEVIDESELSEGRLVEVKIGKDDVLYQVIDGVTHEEMVQQKNKYGYARARARKIGRWNKDKKKFEAVSWLPNINSPVFLRDESDFAVAAGAIGHFPKTDYSVSINPHEAVTHNTAILGILGIGKSFLAIEMVERMIAEGIKVICLDLTDQYAKELGPFVDSAYQAALETAMQPPPGRGQASTTIEDGGSIKDFHKRAGTQIDNFLSDNNPYPICILNPANFQVWKQASWKDKEGEADMVQLTPTEITAIISHHALRKCQELGMTDKARVCLVYEEAHSLVPEWNSVAADGDKRATAASARAILQGRKFGLGCLLITQRTANVTKTILNQCNTIFAMRTFDTTSEGFLSNYIGEDYASILPSLQPRHAVFFGKASSCDDPVLIRLNDRDKFESAFRAAHPPANLPAFTAKATVTGNDETNTNDEDDETGPRIRQP